MKGSMASLPNSRTVTYEEWLRLPEVSDAVEEVVDGEIRIMPPPKWKHSEIVDNLFAQIRLQIDPRQIKVKASQFGLIIRRSPLTTRVPDLAVFQADTIVEQDGYIHSAPQLVVEVLSPANNRREREEKLADYASLGVPEAWVVSPEGLTVEVLHLKEGQLRTTDVLKAGLLKPVHFPGVQIDIARIWPD
jgi:Uma2 family endonuclease